MRLPCIGIMVLALLGCSPWPPHEEELTANFQRHRTAFDELADMFSDSPYPYVQLGYPYMTEVVMVDLESEILQQYETTEGLIFSTSKIADDGTEFFDQPVDNPALIALMNTVGLPTLSRGSEGARIIFNVKWIDPTNGQPSIAYMRDPVSKAKLQRCEPSFRAYDCGRCKIDLDDDWFLFYAWSPPQHELIERYGEEGVYERYLRESQEGGIRSDEFWKDLVASIDACNAASEPVISFRNDPWERS